ncbi:fam-a protein [Plasmodium vinckei brucechwatti]|uniref:Fam-a protein n=1 Tax=Plasmodium vinckei brucechwatti TaxID=119398 RepID=A0A6V7S2U4_PLAVN|nr:fam-a protein [Plasmodium vinckei brucechwatti]
MNKFYILIVFFLLSIFIYVNNKTLAIEPAPGKNTKTKTKTKPEKTKEKTKEITKTEAKPEKTCSTPEEIYAKNKRLLCTNSKETINAEKLMSEAVTQLEHHATSKDGYKMHRWDSQLNNVLHKKKHGDTVVQKFYLIYYHSKMYNEIINMLWDPALANNFNNGEVERKVARVYNPNLVIIHQRYKNSFFGRWKYFYALAAKVEISKEKTIIVMASANINDGYPSKKEYKNKIIEKANSFKTDINSENDIRSGKLKKTFVNIAGYIIEKKQNSVGITYLESIHGHISDYQDLIIEKALGNFFHYKKNQPYGQL